MRYLVVFALFALAACVQTPVSEADKEIRRQCLREIGVDVPDNPAPGSGTIMTREMVQALRACVADKGGAPI
jgi:hypothetical protein